MSIPTMVHQPYMSHSPPPLQHPKPTHIAYPPPEPPHTPAQSTDSSPYSQPQRISQDGYLRYSSPPAGEPSASSSGFSSYAPSLAQGQQSAQPRQPYGQGGTPGVQSVHGYAAPGYAWPGMNDATAQMGMQFGKSAVAAGQEYVEKNFTRYLPLQLIKVSFSVTNTYVLKKLRLILFPWRHKPWSRQNRRSTDNGAVEGWQAPRDDINAPDLYIPTMALVTYTLLCALASGLQSRFHPEVLGLSLSKALAVVITEFCAIKLGCYLLDVRGSGASGVELVGYGGYKFVGIIATIVVSLLGLGKMITLGVFIYTFAANAFFLLRSLKYVLLPDASVSSSVTTLSHSQRSRRVQFLFFVAVAQVLWMGWLSRV
uniref:Protein YIF1 n=2 Tax=Cryptococcus bacillisporus CA1280 TaxID=1296109 RepID=A0A0D0VS49_CRYGA|nr:ER to Golgi transporter Yif1 [Cryptococcus bacillisporus CA1280]